MQNMLKYLMRLRLHVSVLLPLSDPPATAERQGKARHLLYLVSEIDVAPRSYQLLHSVRAPVTRRDVDWRASILGERVREVGWGGVGWWRRRAGVVDIYIYIHIYIYVHTYTMQVRYFPVIYCCYIIAIQTTMDRLMILVVI
jgi:hypothetical protein